MASCGFLMAILSVGVARCRGDQCTGGQTRCNGNVTEYCGEAGSDDPTLVWNGYDCGARFCQPIMDPDISAYPLCTLTKQPDPRCASADQLEFCDGDVVVGCRNGYVLFTANCTTGATVGREYIANWFVKAGTYCSSSGTWAQCTPEPTPNPLCPAAPASAWVCDGSRTLECVQGYAAAITSCPNGACFLGAGRTYCSLAQAADPVCSPDQEYFDFCRGGVIEHCLYGWIVSQETCGTNYTCGRESGSVTCVSK